MLSYVLPVEEKVGLRGEDEERSPGSETRPLLGSGEGASLMVLQHALTHAPGHEDAPEKPPMPASPPLNGDHQYHTTTITTTSMETPLPPPPPPQDASVDSTATSSTATSPGLQPHHQSTPVNTTITTTTTTTAKPNLKRVSFGSSKGSMVETLIYDSPVGEEERIPEEEDAPHSTPAAPHFKDPVSLRFGTETGAQQKPASKVRVTFYESSKPLIVTSPEPSDLDQYSPQDLLMASPTAADPHMPAFDRQISTESGRDNPFRPDGDISREADQIVEAIKSGRPLLAPPASPDAPDAPSPQGTPVTEPLLTPTEASSPQEAPVKPQGQGRTGQGRGANLGSPGKAGANGSAPGDSASTPGPVEVKHVTVSPTEATDVERVVIKKKNKCGCCVIQ
ncbi:cell surface glycoprotein 1-like isoform X2 [Eriocheir sinensis]|uniref:cell surface glycoprotein 1-like isoform X2 n=1 Tax=Eriocheir sinensis TaxID=95602 RepID=UPI0021C7856D|nr:cell surface glycoprotein 1-like isoform X2 [Eriocheir sinensis]